MPDRRRILVALRRCWSSQTSSKWSPSRPAAGQCSVTALVVHDRFGGRLLKTRLPDGWHFYNELDGVVHDFTAEQFETPVEYEHEPATRSEALRDTTQSQYACLRAAFAFEWER